MVSKEQINDIFEYYEVHSGVDSVFDNWVVSREADVINVDKKYPIYTQQVKSEDVASKLGHMREKTWFDSSEEENFLKAYERAHQILDEE